MSSLSAFLRLSRPHFLLGGALMYAMGVASGAAIGVATYLVGQLMVTAAQITAHFVNEYADVEADRLVTNRTFFSGGSGVLAQDQLPPLVALRAALVSSALAGFAALVVGLTSPSAAILGIVALGVSWAYSMPPVRLLDTGWGEVATSLVVVFLVPLIGVLITGASPPLELWWACAVLLPVHVAMMLVFEIPDTTTDRMAGKTVLAVRIGEPRTVGLIAVLYVASGLVALVAGPSGYRGFNRLLVGVLAAVLVAVVFQSLRRRRYGLATATAVGVLIVLGTAFLILLVIA